MRAPHLKTGHKPRGDFFSSRVPEFRTSYLYVDQPKRPKEDTEKLLALQLGWLRSSSERTRSRDRVFFCGFPPNPTDSSFGKMLRSVLAFLACLAVTSVMGFAPPLGVQRTVVRASAPTMQFGGSALDGMNEELQKVTVCGELVVLAVADPAS